MATNTEVGSAYCTIYPTLSKNWSGQLTKSAAIGGAFGAITSKAFDAVANSMGSAIKRLDTLNNFPKVMKNLGFSVQDSSASLTKLGKAIDGLPTSLDSIAHSTQVLAPLTSGLDEATNLSIALNNAMLASGKGAFEASRALTQYTQMFAKGKPDMQSWRIMQEVMPAQLDQIAKKLLGASASNRDLYESMQAGTLTFQDFNRAVLELNENGLQGFASFATQAKDATNGVGTALENVQNRIARAVEDILNYIGQENIANAINSISENFAKLADIGKKAVDIVEKAFEELAPVIVPIIDDIKDSLTKAVDTLGNLDEEKVDRFAGVLAKLAAGFIALKTHATALNVLSGVVSVLTPVVTGVITLVKAFSNIQSLEGAKAVFKVLMFDLKNAINPIGLMVGVISVLVGAFVYFWTTSETFRETVTGAIDAVMNTFNAFISHPAIEFVRSALVDAFSVLGGAISNLMNSLSGLAPFFSVLGKVIGFVLGLAFRLAGAIGGVLVVAIGTCINVFAGLVSVVTNVMSTIFSVVTLNWEGVKSSVVGIIDGLKTAIFGTFAIIANAIGINVNAVKTTIVNAFTGAINTVVNVFNNMYNNVVNTFNNVKNFIRGIIDKIKGMFNFNWSLPKIKLPHLSWSMIDVPFLGKVPDPTSIRVDWYAKGGIFSAPSVIGVGEAGKEAVLPIDKIKPYIAEAMNDNRAPVGSIDNTDVIEWLDKNLGVIIEQYAPTATPREFSRMVRAYV